MSTIGFVVLERNQAGGLLTIPGFADIHLDREEAEQDRQQQEEQSRAVGRRDRYVIATLEVAEDDRD